MSFKYIKLIFANRNPTYCQYQKNVKVQYSDTLLKFVIRLSMNTKSGVKDKIMEIMLERQKYDSKFDKAHRMLTDINSSKINVGRLRSTFLTAIEELKQIVRTHSKELQMLKSSCQTLQKEGVNMQSVIREIDSLKQYFKQLENKAKEEQKKGEAKLTERQRWQLTQGSQHDNIDEESRLIMASGAARQTRQMAGIALSGLKSQTDRLESAREKMGNVLRSINLSGNLLHLIKSRSKEDNKLIILLSIGLIVEIFVCLYIVRPLVHGQ